MTFDPTKPVECVDIDGTIRPARILATGLAGSVPIAAAVTESDGSEWVVATDTNGRMGYSHLRNRMVKREGWVRVLGTVPRMAGSTIYGTEVAAKMDHGRVDTVAFARIEWEEPADAR